MRDVPPAVVFSFLLVWGYLVSAGPALLALVLFGPWVCLAVEVAVGAAVLTYPELVLWPADWLDG